jgi:hypothetical protein
MARIAINDKQPLVLGATDIFPINWKPRLKLDTIVSSTWLGATGVTVGVTTFNATATEAHFTGVTEGVHCVTNTIVTAQSRTLIGTFVITVTKPKAACS